MDHVKPKWGKVLLNSFNVIAFSLQFNSKQAAFIKTLLQLVDGRLMFWLKNFPFKKIVTFTSKICALAKELLLLRWQHTKQRERLLLCGSSANIPRNFVLTKDYFSQLLNSIFSAGKKTIQDLASRRTAKKNKRRQRTGCDSDLVERPHYKCWRAKNHDQKLWIKQVKVTKEN